MRIGDSVHRNRVSRAIPESSWSDKFCMEFKLPSEDGGRVMFGSALQDPRYPQALKCSEFVIEELDTEHRVPLRCSMPESSRYIHITLQSKDTWYIRRNLTEGTSIFLLEVKTSNQPSRT
ncbi:hypothetical protein QCA50_004618 [Cerrena zonata]|uniref:Uncharacterized protein n=1 Tax=Cerrena zonata TaxID=2478898 RepID=A0AAW0GJZ2_9APHY